MIQGTLQVNNSGGLGSDTASRLQRHLFPSLEDEGMIVLSLEKELPLLHDDISFECTESAYLPTYETPTRPPRPPNEYQKQEYDPRDRVILRRGWRLISLTLRAGWTKRGIVNNTVSSPDSDGGSFLFHRTCDDVLVREGERLLRACQSRCGYVL